MRRKCNILFQGCTVRTTKGIHSGAIDYRFQITLHFPFQDTVPCNDYMTMAATSDYTTTLRADTKNKR